MKPACLTIRRSARDRDLALQVLATDHLQPRVKVRRLDRLAHLVKGVHQHLDVQLVHVVEKVADAVLVAHVVQQQQLDVAGGDVRRDEVVVEFVDALEVPVRRRWLRRRSACGEGAGRAGDGHRVAAHVRRGPHGLVDHVERRVQDELVEVRLVLALGRARAGSGDRG